MNQNVERQKDAELISKILWINGRERENGFEFQTVC